MVTHKFEDLSQFAVLVCSDCVAKHLACRNGITCSELLHEPVDIHEDDMGSDCFD